MGAFLRRATVLYGQWPGVGAASGGGTGWQGPRHRRHYGGVYTDGVQDVWGYRVCIVNTYLRFHNVHTYTVQSMQ